MLVLVLRRVAVGSFLAAISIASLDALGILKLCGNHLTVLAIRFLDVDNTHTL